MLDVCQLDECKEMAGLRRGTEIGPGWVVELCDFANRREGVRGVAESELADDDMRGFGCCRRVWGKRELVSRLRSGAERRCGIRTPPGCVKRKCIRRRGP